MKGYLYLWRLAAPWDGPLWAMQLAEEETSAVGWAKWTFEQFAVCVDDSQIRVFQVIGRWDGMLVAGCAARKGGHGVAS